MPLKEALILALDLPETDWRPDYGSKEEVRVYVLYCVWENGIHAYM